MSCHLADDARHEVRARERSVLDFDDARIRQQFADAGNRTGLPSIVPVPRDNQTVAQRTKLVERGLVLEPRLDARQDGLGARVVEYLVNAEPGVANIYFNRAPIGGTADIYRAWITRDGETMGAATLIPELSHPTGTDQGVTLRVDAREIVFFSTRPGGFGGNDLWTATRSSARAPWSAPVNLGPILNTAAAEQQPSLSFDGTVLLFASSRAGSSGGTDIWMTTRTPSGTEAP